MMFYDWHEFVMSVQVQVHSSHIHAKAPLNIASAIVLTLGNKVVLYFIVTNHRYMPNSLSCCLDTRSHTFGAYANFEQALGTGTCTNGL